MFGNTLQSLTFLKSQGTSTDSLLARIMFNVDNNEQLFFNRAVISTYLINNPVTSFPSGVLKTQIFYILVPTFILNIND